MGKSLKYKVGDKIFNWQILDINDSDKNVSYDLKCICGVTRTCKSNKMSQLTLHCRICACGEKSKKYIGQRFGKLIVLDNPRIDGIRKLLVKCDCEKEYYVYPAQLKLTNSCKDCCRVYSPNLILDGITFIERINGGIWKMQCRCGNIFEKTLRKYKGKLIGCGCHQKNYYSDRVKQKIGLKYKFLTVKKILRNENGHYILQMKCKCGNLFERKNGHEFKSESCGCMQSINTPKGEKKGNARFKEYEIISIREMFKSKQYSVIELAEIFNCYPGYISRIIRKTIWKDDSLKIIKKEKEV